MHVGIYSTTELYLKEKVLIGIGGKETRFI